MYRVRIIMGAFMAVCIAFALVPSTALCIPRDVVISRGIVWVNYVRGVDPKTHKKILGVAYSQSKWAKESGAPITAKKPAPSTVGYRTDCSGFASLCWNLRDAAGHPVSLSTREFGARGSKRFFPITKAQLQPGDMILASAVWGAPSPHAIIFNGWANATQTRYWALEQTTSRAQGVTGCVLHERDYGQPYFKPYRYSGLDDAYADVEEPVSSADPAAIAALGAKTAYAATSSIPALVVVGSSQWGDQLAAATLSGAVGGPVLLSGARGVPAATVAQIRRLKPRQIIVVGATTSVGHVAASQLASLAPSVVRISGGDRYQIAAAVAPSVMAWGRARKRAVDHAYLVPGGGTAEALSIAPVAARTGAPLLFANKSSLPKATLWSLKRLGVRRVVLVGETNVLDTRLAAQLRKLGFRVDRVGGKDGYKTSVAVARYALTLGVGFTLQRIGVVTPSSCSEALAAASSLGATRSLVVLTPANALDLTVRWLVAIRRGEIGRARVFGTALSPAARKSLAIALRSGK